MVFNTNKEKGNSGLGAAIAYYTFKGYTISIPLNDTQDYDLIVDNNEKLLKIQIKSTGQRSPQGYSIVTIRSTGGTKGFTYKTLIETDIDILFVLTELGEMYEIPIADISTTSSINLGPDRQCYRIDDVDTQYLKKEYNSTKNIKYCSSCGKEVGIRNISGLCNICASKEKRIVERPSKEQLLKELKESNFVQVGKKYGVSDNSIRKWCKSYNLPTHISEIKELEV